MALAVTSRILSGASLSMNILQRAGTKDLGGHLGEKDQTQDGLKGMWKVVLDSHFKALIHVVRH